MFDSVPDQYIQTDWSVRSKMIKKLITAFYANYNVLYFNEDSGDAVFSCNKMGILSIYFNNINLDDTNYDEDDPETIIHIILLAWHIKFEKRKALKKELNEELMLVAWHPRRWWNFCMSEDEEEKKKENTTKFY